MGYYSDVALAMQKKDYAEMLDKAKLIDVPDVRREVLELLDKQGEKYESEEHIVLYWENIKWYPIFPEIEWIKENKPETYAFLRVGEDMDDVEYSSGAASSEEDMDGLLRLDRSIAWDL